MKEINKKKQKSNDLDFYSSDDCESGQETDKRFEIHHLDALDGEIR